MFDMSIVLGRRIERHSLRCAAFVRHRVCYTHYLLVQVAVTCFIVDLKICFFIFLVCIIVAVTIQINM